MNRCLAYMHRALICLSLALPLALPVAAQASVLNFVVFNGQGNLLFDNTTGLGVWLGTVEEFPDPALASPLSLTSRVDFNFDTAANALTGSFEMIDNATLGFSLLGTLSGRLTQGGLADTDPGGQFEVDYQITGGTGRFDGAFGFGLSFVNFGALDAGFRSYTEDGLLVFAVPEPAGWALASTALLMLLATRRKAAPLN